MVRFVKPNVNSCYLNTHLIRLPIKSGSSLPHKRIQFLLEKFIRSMEIVVV